MNGPLEGIDPRIARTVPYLQYLYDWESGLRGASLQSVIDDAGGPDRVAFFVVDLIKGFTTQGPLSSARVGALVPRVARLLERAHGLGVRQFVILQDAHPPDSPEFGDLPPHCVIGTEEAEMDEGLAALPFADTFTIFEKKSLDATVGTQLLGWYLTHSDIRRIVVVGDCTDLCVYELAMSLQMRAHVHGHDYEVVVPANCADTFDLPVETARAIGARPHDGDLLHRIFLHQMAANGVGVVASLDD